MLRGLVNKIKALMLLEAQSISADTNSTAVDLSPYRSFAFLVSVGTFTFSGTNKVALKMVESDDNITFTDCALSCYVGGAIKELITAGDGETMHVVEYKGNKRYAKLFLDVSGTVAAPMAVVGLSTDLVKLPS